MRKAITILLLVVLITTQGCALHFYKKHPKDKEKIDTLSGEVKKLRDLRAKEKEEFSAIKKELAEELKDTKVKLKMRKGGIVITLADNILFDSGRAKIKQDAYPVLGKIASIIKDKASDKNIGIEGHTDNVPIKQSGWKSNRELSTARANNVYHHLVKKGKLTPSKLTTMGYGEFRPIAGNNTKTGRAKNRRVEIVILPRYLKKPASEVKDTPWVK